MRMKQMKVVHVETHITIDIITTTIIKIKEEAILITITRVSLLNKAMMLKRKKTKMKIRSSMRYL